MEFGICGCPVESDVHALVECPLAENVWEGCCFDMELLTRLFKGVRDWLEMAVVRLDEEQLGEFVAVAWECWNVRNRF